MLSVGISSGPLLSLLLLTCFGHPSSPWHQLWATCLKPPVDCVFGRTLRSGGNGNATRTGKKPTSPLGPQSPRQVAPATQPQAASQSSSQSSESITCVTPLPAGQSGLLYRRVPNHYHVTLYFNFLFSFT